jgi:hypothetical protein
VSIIDELPLCKKCGGRPVVLGDPHSNRAICCENEIEEKCDNYEFDTCIEGAVLSWLKNNSKTSVKKYLQLECEIDDLDRNMKCLKSEKQILTTDLENVIKKLSKEDKEIADKVLSFFRR